MKPRSVAIINGEEIKQVYKHLPHIKPGTISGVCCGRCFYINDITNNFCTNCGRPMHEGESVLLYQFRTKQRSELLQKSNNAIQFARILLYVIAGLCTVGIGFLFGDMQNPLVFAFIMLAVSALFFVLARWSLSKPFTALLTGFVIIATFSTVAIFGELTSIFTSVEGLYSIVFSAIVSWFLLRGVRGAYKADLINEELNIH